MKGPEGFRKFLTSVFAGFPDFNVRIEDIIAEGDKVCGRGKFLGTHTGKYYDPSIGRELAPTGRKISIPFCITYRLLNGKAVESWTVENLLDFCKQLDIIDFK
jgi:predicted ester cyclase